MSVISWSAIVLKIIIFFILFFFLNFLNILLILQPRVFKTVYPFLTQTDQFDWSSDEQLDYSSDIADQLNSGSSFTRSRVELSNQEIQHMQDVSQVLRLIKLGSALLGSLMISIIWKLYRKKVFNKIILNNFLTQAMIFYLMIISGLGLMIFFFWPVFFRLIHHIVFPQGNWTFPADSALIRLFPDIFWQRTVVTVVIAVLIEIAGLCIFVRFMSKVKNSE